VLRIRRAAAVACDQDLAVCAQGARDGVGDGENRSRELAIARNAAERFERAVEIGRNGVIAFGHAGLRWKVPN
jgi:hypothetical protein